MKKVAFVVLGLAYVAALSTTTGVRHLRRVMVRSTWTR